jgi:hypothetical protein
MGFRDVLIALKPSFDAVVARAGIQAVEWVYGAQNIINPGAPPRIAWVPWHSKFGGNSRSGGVGADGKLITNPRPLFVRNMILAAHVWGKDESACESLINAVIIAMKDTLWGSFRPVSEDWTAGEVQSKLAAGVLAIFHVEVDIPSTREVDDLAHINGFTITPVVEPISGG